MKNGINDIEVRIQPLSEHEKSAYGYGAEYQAEISFGINNAIIIVDSCLKTIKLKLISSNQSDLFGLIGDYVSDRIMLSDLLLKFK